MNKVALITGGNRGIGLETARQLGGKGITILVAARSLDKAKAGAETLTAAGINVHPIQLDVNNPKDISRTVTYIDTAYGKLDILVNNAGIIQGEGFGGDSTLDIKYDDMVATFNTNLFAVVSLTQRLLPLIRKSEAGRIVNLSSILGSLSMHADSNSPIYNSRSFAYNASKAALNQFTIHLAASLSDTNIKVNSVHPGWVQTDMGGEQATMTIEEGAKTSVDMALLEDDGPTGKYMHMGEELPW